MPIIQHFPWNKIAVKCIMQKLHRIKSLNPGYLHKPAMKKRIFQQSYQQELGSIEIVMLVWKIEITSHRFSKKKKKDTYELNKLTLMPYSQSQSQTCHWAKKLLPKITIRVTHKNQSQVSCPWFQKEIELQKCSESYQPASSAADDRRWHGCCTSISCRSVKCTSRLHIYTCMKIVEVLSRQKVGIRCIYNWVLDFT